VDALTDFEKVVSGGRCATDRPDIKRRTTGSEGVTRGCCAAPPLQALLEGSEMIESVQVWNTSHLVSIGVVPVAGLVVLGVADSCFRSSGTPLLITGWSCFRPTTVGRNCLGRVRVWTRKLHLHRSKPAHVHRSSETRVKARFRMERQPQPPTISTEGERHQIDSQGKRFYPTTNSRARL